MDLTVARTAGFDADGVWRLDKGTVGGGRFAKRGWSGIKRLIVDALDDVQVRDEVQRRGVGWLTARDNYLSRLGVLRGQAVKVRYLNDEFGVIDALHPDGAVRPVKVKWGRFDGVVDDLPSVDGPTYVRRRRFPRTVFVAPRCPTGSAAPTGP